MLTHAEKKPLLVEKEKVVPTVAVAGNIKELKFNIGVFGLDAFNKSLNPNNNSVILL